MGELADGICEDWGEQIPDVVHAHFWMSGLAAIQASGGQGLPTPFPWCRLSTPSAP